MTVAEYKHCLNALNTAISDAEKELPSLNAKSDIMREINKVVWKQKRLPVLYRYVPLNEYAISSIVNEDVYLLSAAKMNDVFEGTAFGVNSLPEVNAQMVDNAQNKLYLKAFSINCVNNLMWSHYADSHKGICIEYDFRYAKQDVVNHLYPVQYSDHQFTFKNPAGLDVHPFLLLRKSKDWRYEKEFRLIYNRDELPKGNPVVKLNCITKIIFGLRTKQADIELVKCLLCGKNHLRHSDKGKEIRLYQIQQKPDSFKLKRVPLS